MERGFAVFKERGFAVFKERGFAVFKERGFAVDDEPVSDFVGKCFRPRANSPAVKDLHHGLPKVSSPIAALHKR